MDTKRMGSKAFHLVIVATALLGFTVVSSGHPARPPGASHHLIGSEKAFSSSVVVRPGNEYSVGEPPLAAAFVAAYARGDEVTADQIASPIYQIEWTRRGLTPASRHALFPTPDPANASDVWLRFTFAGGGLDGKGFGHLLYLAQPPSSSGNTFPSVWRVDTDPLGRVIWAELVFLFSGHSAAVLPDRSGAATQPRLIAGVRSVVGQEAYYAIAISPPSPEPHARALTYDIAFFGVDDDGQIRPGAWSYGQANSVPSAYGQLAAAPTVTLDPNLAALRQSYIQTLH